MFEVCIFIEVKYVIFVKFFQNYYTSSSSVDMNSSLSGSLGIVFAA